MTPFPLTRTVCAFAALFMFPAGLFAQDFWSLQRCINYAFEHNITIAQAGLGETSAELSEQGAKAAFLPSLNAIASHGYNFGQTLDPFTNSFATSRIQSNSFGLSSGMSLFNGFKKHLQLEQARLGLDQAQTATELAQNGVALTVAAAFLNVLYQEEFVKVAEVNRETTLRQTERVSKLVEAGASPVSDRLEVEAQLAADDATLIQARNGLDLGRLNLAQILQLSAERGKDLLLARPSADELAGMEIPGSVEAAVAHAISAFPEIRQAELTVEGAHLGIELAEAGRWPSLWMSYNMGSGYSGARTASVGSPEMITVPIGSVAGSGEQVNSVPQTYYSNYETVSFGDQVGDNRNQSLSFSLNVPIFNGLATKLSIEQATVDVLRAEYGMEQALQTLRATVESTWTDAKAAKKSLEAQNYALEAAQLAFDQLEKQYELGAASALDYADGRGRLDAARLRALQAQYDFAFKRQILRFYLGQPLTFRS